MIVAIVVTGILLSMVGMFTRNQITSYFDVAARTELADAADTTLRRMARDLQAALPNSVRVDASGRFLEFLPIKSAGRYRAEVGINPLCPAGPPCDDPLDFTSAAATESFEVYGSGATVAANDQLVIYNLGSASSYDAYTGESRRVLTTTGSGLSSLTYNTGGTQFLLASPQNRFQIVGTPVSYVCDLASGTLWRYSAYAIQAAQPATLATLDALANVARTRLASDVSACSFSYADAVLQRNGLVSIRLSLTHHGNGESVTLVHQIDVMNTP